MDDLNRFDRAILNWFAKRSYRVAAVAPVVVLFVVLLAGILVATTLAGRSALDPFVLWIVSVGVIAAMAMYVTSLYSFYGALENSRRYKLLRLHQTIAAIRAMNWQDFEDLVAAYLQERGFDVEHQGRDSADGGVDLVARRNGKVWLVQCKHKRDDWVGERPIRELLGLVQHRNADGGFLVCCGDFDRKAREFVRSSPEIRLVGAEKLQARLEQVLRDRDARRAGVAQQRG